MHIYAAFVSISSVSRRSWHCAVNALHWQAHAPSFRSALSYLFTDAQAIDFICWLLPPACSQESRRA